MPRLPAVTTRGTQSSTKEVSDGQVVRLDDALFAAAEDEVEAALKHFRFKKARALHEKSRATHENLDQYARRSHARLG